MSESFKEIFFDWVPAVGNFILWGVCKLAMLVYKNWGALLTFATAVATVGAAVATWRAAKKAAESAQIARESMDATMALGQQTLEETRLTNKRTAFETRYAMLLAQHDQYHLQLCDYLDTGKISGEEYKERVAVTTGQIDIYQFFNESVNAPSLDACFSFLTGHEIISRYMRTLYHLLKFVDKDCTFINDDRLSFQRKYTSPVRSTIRNDVLLLIAVNALNVDDLRAKESSYPYYQQLLHKFDFFEHAIFKFPFEPNELFKSKEWVENIQQHVLRKQSDFINELDFKTYRKCRTFTIPDVRLFSPLIMTLIIFKNPMREATLMALNTLSENTDFKVSARGKVEKGIEFFETGRSQLAMIPQWQMKPTRDASWEPVNEITLTSMQQEAFSDFSIYTAYLFSDNESDNPERRDGEQILEYFRWVKRYDNLVDEVGKLGGINEYMDNNAKILAERLKAFNGEMKKYDVRESQ